MYADCTRLRAVWVLEARSRPNGRDASLSRKEHTARSIGLRHPGEALPDASAVVASALQSVGMLPPVAAAEQLRNDSH